MCDLCDRSAARCVTCVPGRRPDVCPVGGQMCDLCDRSAARCVTCVPGRRPDV